MEQENKKRRTGQNIAFYTALAVCLIAVGVGTWELLQPERSGSGAAAVSSAVALPGGGAAAGAESADFNAESASGGGAVTDGSAAQEAGTVTGSAAQESGAVAGSAAQESGAVAGSAARESESVAGGPQAVSGAASVPKETAAKADVKAKESGTKAEQSGAKSKDSAAKNSSESESAKATHSKADAKTEKPKLSGEVTRPVEGETVTGFSMDKLLYNETMRDWRTHDGIDIAAEPGTAVMAARAGTVESVTADPVMGVTVVIRHADKWESVYASLADMAEVEAGDDVIAGQVIGFVGETAASESALGPHLHFSALNDGVPADPEAFLA